MNDNPRSITRKCMVQLEKMDIRLGKIHRNLSVPSLIEIAIHRKEGVFSLTGALSVKTGKFTGRSPDDRYIVDDNITHNSVDWGKINVPISQQKFEKIFRRMKKYVEGREFFVFDGYVGADIEIRLPIRVITDKAWHSFFATQIFIRPTMAELENFSPAFTLLSVNDFRAIPGVEGTRTETFIIISFGEKMVLIGSTSYAGEIKKAMFSVMNYLLPKKGVFPMHCSANVGVDGNTALFFGLSGTGKTTLSTDPERHLVGDDEHGWSDKGIFNFEGGCYAKCINLKKENEPEIWKAIRFGAVMENVIIKEGTREPDFGDGSLTENTRVVYPIEFIPGARTPSVAGHPKVIVFLTADAFGVMPPIAKLTQEGAMYHFMSGYTSKLAGTERGITEPKETFSQCFGAPFMPLHAKEYANMLGKKIAEHNTKVYLINTGWSGGPYGIGKRMNLKYTRAMVTAALNGDLEKVPFKHNDIFNLEIPTLCPGVPSTILDPSNTWADNDKYIMSAKRLAALFVNNFEKFGEISKEIRNAGPLL
ncbi:MAG: phosphoenolpyruvate carboxykinase (ATP) [Nitrososphaeraceae archaeon]|nr:phosphoenolpyruvate carboxykinase (ATP) [Nitrososphaeraceae archaeon]MBV9667855.1 phosphoenolpyruvate carboxykinase (ATP) [Nitrososphaeraceae archaeon]